jgi:hypothetical protein
MAEKQATEQVGLQATLYAYIWEVFGLNFGQISWFFSVSAGI